MVSARAIVATKPIFPYGSRGYSILYYGASRKSSFTVSQIKSCLSGKFPLSHTNQDFLEPANRLIKAGLLVKTEPHTYVVTNNGIREMVAAVAFYRESRARTVSQAYLNETAKRINKIHGTNMSLMEKLDAEDLVLNEIQDKVNVRNEKKNKSRRR